MTRPTQFDISPKAKVYPFPSSQRALSARCRPVAGHGARKSGIIAEGESVWSALKDHEKQHPTVSPFWSGAWAGFVAGCFFTVALAWIWALIGGVQ